MLPRLPGKGRRERAADGCTCQGGRVLRQDSRIKREICQLNGNRCHLLRQRRACAGHKDLRRPTPRPASPSGGEGPPASRAGQHPATVPAPDQVQGERADGPVAWPPSHWVSLRDRHATCFHRESAPSATHLLVGPVTAAFSLHGAGLSPQPASSTLMATAPRPPSLAPQPAPLPPACASGHLPSCSPSATVHTMSATCGLTQT